MEPIKNVRIMPQSLTDDEFRDRAALAYAAALTCSAMDEEFIPGAAFDMAEELVVERARRKAEREGG